MVRRFQCRSLLDSQQHRFGCATYLVCLAVAGQRQLRQLDVAY